MIAIFWREIRSIGKWAFMASLILAGVVGAAAYVSVDVPGDNLLLVNPVIAGILSVGFVVAGFTLGILAVTPDYAKGRWALLTHRPIGRRRVFLAKFSAECVLLGLAGGAPLVGLAVWMAIPGNVAAPFDWHMLLPRLAEMASGGCCVAAGMLTAARAGHLAGSRLLPAIAALLVCGYAELVPHPLPIVYLIFLGATEILAVAAGWAFIHCGEFEPMPLAGRLVQTTILAVGVLVIVLIVVVLGDAGLSWLFPELPEQTSVRHSPAYSIDGAGQAYVSELPVHAWEIDPGAGAPLLASGSRYVQQLTRTGRWCWYAVPNRRTIEAYDALTRRYLGGLGPTGFVPAPAPPQPFPDELLVSPDGTVFGGRFVWRVTTGVGGEVELAYTAPPGERIVDVLDVKGEVEWGRVVPGTVRMAVITQSAVHLVHSGHEVMHFPLDSRVRRFEHIEFQFFEDAGLVMLFMPQNVVIDVDGAGHIIRETELPPLPEPEPTAWIGTRIFNALSAPPMLMWLKIWPPGERRDLWISLFSAALAANICWLLLWRYPASLMGKCWWLLVCLLLGWAGVILLLCTRTAIVRVKCPKCRRSRFITQDRCRHCGAPFPPPARTGVEIFEANQTVGAAT
jgi:hypothetical protein